MAGTYVGLPNRGISGLVPVTSGAAAATGTISEVLTASQVTSTATGVGATTVYGNVTSLAITAGRWRVFGVAAFVQNGAVLTGGLQAGISTSSSGVGLNEFDTQLSGLNGTGVDLLLYTPELIINIASTTTYFLNTKFTYSSGSPQHRGKITALRIG
jgi:hypothetical protein